MVRNLHHTVVGCRDGSRYVEGCWRFTYLKMKKFLGFLVSRFLGFFLVQVAISYSPEDIDPIFKIFKISFNGSAGFAGSGPFCMFRDLPNRRLRSR